MLGYDDLQPTPAQQASMEHLVAECMDQGARGISTGLFYPPGIFAQAEEVVGLCRVVAKKGGICASHIRSESDLLLESVAEALDIGQRAGVFVEIAHLKLSGYRNWPGLNRLLDTLETALARDIHFGCDQYPYRASSTWLGAILPPWAQAGGAKAIASRLSEPSVRSALRIDYVNNPIDWDNRSGVREWDDILVTECFPRPDVVGHNIAQIAEMWGKDPLDTLFDLIEVSEGQAAAVWFDQAEENVRTIMRHPLVVVGSDGYAMSPAGILAQRQVHPRSYGTFPRVLGHYVRDEKLLSLEEAVRKMTSTTASRFGLQDRGLVREGAWADLVLLDSAAVADRATFTNPHQYPLGIPYVMTNGALVIDQGTHTGALPGRVL
jgi:N-acyl-D-aspartate/D-glutamate deacylase